MKHNSYKEHLKNVHSSEIEKNFLENGSKDQLTIKCQSCDLLFLTKALQQRHASRYHPATLLKSQISTCAVSKLRLPSYCSLCYYEFKFHSKLKEHRSKLHTTKEEIETFDSDIDASTLKLSCSICNKKFLNIGSLKYHRQYTHTKENKMLEEIACEFCNKKFKWKNRNNLKKHIQVIHNISNYDLDEYSYNQKSRESENNASMNFLNVLNSLLQ